MAPLVQASDVAAAYRLVLGREPESEAVIAARLGTPLARLLPDLLGSEEFRTAVLPLLQAGGPFPDGDGEGDLHARLAQLLHEHVPQLARPPDQPRWTTLMGVEPGEAVRRFNALRQAVGLNFLHATPAAERAAFAGAEPELAAEPLADELWPLFPPSRYERPPIRSYGAPVFAARSAAHLHREAARFQAGLPGCWVADIEKAVVCRSVVYVPHGDGRAVLQESYRANDRIDTELRLDLLGRGAPDAWIEGEALYLGASGSHNWGHWLTDDLPRALALKGRPALLVMPSFGPVMDAAREASVALLLGGPRPIRFVHPAQAIGFERLLYPTPVTHHPILKSRPALAASRQACVGSVAAGSGKLWVRRTGPTRALLNGEVLEAALGQRGFELFDPAAHTPVVQARRFAEATTVVGVMGAAMTGTCFSAQRTKVIHLAPEGWLEPYFWDLAGALGHDYAVVYGRSDPNDAPAHLAGFTVEVADVLAALDRTAT